MLNSHSPQQHTTSEPAYPLTKAALRRFEQQELRGHHWVCGGCGMTHAVILPEECENCGATALEFQYASSTENKGFSA
jgi:rubrerythrin